MKSQDIRYVNFKRSLELKVCCVLQAVCSIGKVRHTQRTIGARLLFEPIGRMRINHLYVWHMASDATLMVHSHTQWAALGWARASCC